jgi:Rod binding domain-containing protein
VDAYGLPADHRLINPPALVAQASAGTPGDSALPLTVKARGFSGASMPASAPQNRLAADANGLNDLKRAATSEDAATQKKAAQEAGKQFEGVFMGMMIKSMRQAGQPFENDLIPKQKSETFENMIDQQLTQDLSGKGLGLAKAMEKQLIQGAPTGRIIKNDHPKREGAILSDEPVKQASAELVGKPIYRIAPRGNSGVFSVRSAAGFVSEQPAMSNTLAKSGAGAPDVKEPSSVKEAAAVKAVGFPAQKDSSEIKRAAWSVQDEVELDRVVLRLSEAVAGVNALVETQAQLDLDALPE